MLSFSDRANGLSPSATLTIIAKAAQLKAQGKDVLNFAAGQPDFDIPNVIKNSIEDALHMQGVGRYAPVDGIPKLKEAIINKFRKDNGLVYKPEEILVSCGAKHTLANAFAAITNPGEEIVIPTPCWVSYGPLTEFYGGKAVYLACDESFSIYEEELKNSITDKTKAIVVNSPSNPTGHVYSDESLKTIADLAVDKGFYILSDEIYEKIIYDKKHTSIASFSEEVKQQTLTINGGSKSFAIPGLRFGYCGGPAGLVKAMTKIQSQHTSNSCSLIQYAIAESFEQAAQLVPAMVEEYKTRRDYIVRRLNAIDGVKCNMPHGAFYAFPDISAVMKDDMEFAKQLLEQKHVALVPGMPFMAPGFVRVSYACSMQQIEEGMNRFEEFVGGLK